MRIRNEDKVLLVKQKTIEMVVKCGFEGFSVNKLAKACGISVATLYIYYKDKDDLIYKVATEEAARMGQIMLQDFDPNMSFADGLRLQWKNRAKYCLENPVATSFFEQLRSSTYQNIIHEVITSRFKETMGQFLDNAIRRGELREMPIEVYWSVAFAPLYALIRFHNEKRSIGGKPFEFNEAILWQTFDLVLGAFIHTCQKEK